MPTDRKCTVGSWYDDSRPVNDLQFTELACPLLSGDWIAERNIYYSS